MTLALNIHTTETLINNVPSRRMTEMVTFCPCLGWAGLMSTLMSLKRSLRLPVHMEARVYETDRHEHGQITLPRVNEFIVMW